MGKGGGGAPTQTSSTVQNTNVPEYARPYVENMLGATQQQLFKMDGSNVTGFQPYKAYGGEYDAAGNLTSYDPSRAIAGFSPLQQQAQQGIAGMQVPGEFGAAAGATQQATQRALGANYAPSNYGSQFNPQGIGYGAQTMQGYQMGPAERVRTQSFTRPGAADAYMSPYMQSVVDIQKREAQRQSGIQGTQQQAQAAQAGAFGGGRDAIMRAERERNLSQQMGDIQAQGSQAAYQQAQQQFNAEQQARLAAQQANQQAGLTVGQQNLSAAQQTGLANQAALNQAGQFNAGQNLQAASLGAQYGQAANQLNEQSRQYGAGYGMQGLQTGLQGANQLASIGSQGLQAQQGIYGLQNQVGQQQQLNQQQVINQAMQDYANAQQYPLMQLGTMSNMLRGLPMQAQTTQQYQAQANPITQGIGAVGALGSLAQMKAEGGAVKSMASGGITSIPRYDVGGEVMSQLATMPDEALKKEATESPSPKVREMAVAILKQRQAGMDARPQMSAAPEGVGPMGVDYNAGYAGGGIIAFADGKKVGTLPPLTEEQKRAMSQGVMQATAAGNTSGKLTGNPQTAPPELLSRNAPAYVGPDLIAPAPAPPPAPEVDPLAGIQLAATNAQAEADKTQETRYAATLAGRKAQGLDNSEARDQYLKSQQAQRADTENTFKNREYLRRAEFFATWGSTPGNTLVAGMTALRKTIPDMVQDSTDKRAAMQQADKILYELGEATRMEKLGMWDEAGKQKQKAAETASNLQEKLATATAGIAGQKISAKGSTDAATIRATSDEKVQGMRDVVDKLKIDSDAETRRQAARLSAQARQDDATGRTDTKNQVLYQGAQSLAATVESRIDNIMKTPAYEQLRQTASMPESSTNKSIIDSAKKALKDYETSFAKQRQMADDALKMAESRVGITRSDAAPTSGATSQAEFDKKWPTLKSGQTLTGPDGKTYTKK